MDNRNICNSLMCRAVWTDMTGTRARAGLLIIICKHSRPGQTDTSHGQHFQSILSWSPQTSKTGGGGAEWRVRTKLEDVLCNEMCWWMVGLLGLLGSLCSIINGQSVVTL